MAASLIGGLIADGYAPQQILVSDPSAEQRRHLDEQFAISASADNAAVASAADVLVFAVKPQQLHVVAAELASIAAARDPLVVSIAAGVREPDLSAWLGYDAAVVRCMPNTPALLRCGASGLYANPRVSDAQRQMAEQILAAAGVVVWVDNEVQLDAVTAVSGSGPAYFFLLMEAIQQAGVELGLPAEQAQLLTLQTALGAARMALESDGQPSPALLRERVTSPGGTTERALAVLGQGDFNALVARAVCGAAERCTELSAELGGDQ